MSRFIGFETGAKALRPLALCLSLALCGCSPKPQQSNAPVAVTSASQESTVAFTDVTKEAGINFKHTNGAAGKKWLPETMGSGLAWFDYDGDGYADLYFVNGREWTPQEKADSRSVDLAPPQGEATGRLYHNNGDGTFTDVTEKAGLKRSAYGMGVCAGDYDNDGHIDLYVTGVGRNYLYRNQGDSTFKEVAQTAGVAGSGWSTSAAWLDYDKDGKLDLVVGRYVQWTPATDIAFPRNGHRTYGTPMQYVGEPLLLFHNEGGGRFKEVAQASGLRANAEGRPLQGKSLGIVICDQDNDGWPDIAVVNDTEPNYLFHNEKNGKFSEIGVETAMALPDSGVARGAMGVDSCDYDASGKESLVIGNFSSQGLTLYHNEGAVFRNVAEEKGIHQATLLSLTFGCFFIDVDNDGWRDIFVANGHVDDDIQTIQKQVEYAEKPHLFRNTGDGGFKEITDTAGAPLQKKFVARGAAYADYDLSGSHSIAFSTNGGSAYLFKNGGDKTNRSVRLELEGVKSNRSAIGARVKVVANGKTHLYYVRSGSSYCSQSELPLTIGVGKQAQINASIEWPSGEKTEIPNLDAGQIYHIVEGKGVADKRPFGQPIRKTVALAR